MEKERPPRLREVASKAVAAKRVEELVRIRLEGAEMWDVREYIHEQAKKPDNPWSGTGEMCDAQIYRYIARADKTIADSCKQSRKRMLRRHLAQRRNWIGKAVNAGDVATACRIADSEADLVGLKEYGRQHFADLEATGTDKEQPIDLGKLTPEQLETLNKWLADAQPKAE